MAPLLDRVLAHCPPPVANDSAPFAMVVTMMGHDAYVGRLLTGRVVQGQVGRCCGGGCSFWPCRRFASVACAAALPVLWCTRCARGCCCSALRAACQTPLEPKITHRTSSLPLCSPFGTQVRLNDKLVAMAADGSSVDDGRVTGLFIAQALERVSSPSASTGDIVTLAGLGKATVGQTVGSPELEAPLAAPQVRCCAQLRYHAPWLSRLHRLRCHRDSRPCCQTTPSSVRLPLTARCRLLYAASHTTIVHLRRRLTRQLSR